MKDLYIKLVMCCDYEALYIDGVKVDEAHMLDVNSVLKLLSEYHDIQSIDFEQLQVFDSYVEENGFPDNISEIPDEYIWF